MTGFTSIDRRSFLAAAGTISITLAAGRAGAAEAFKLRELYNKDLSFSDFALSLEGEEAEVEGFMAPPLKVNTRFFVLTGRPMAVCPLCESEAEWPDDILAIYARRTIRVVPFNWPIVTRGTLELGTYRDEEFNFVSRVRLVDAAYERA